MKYTLTICCFFLYIFNSFSQENPYKEVSYTEFFKMIEAHRDSVVNLNDILIKYDASTDAHLTQTEYFEGRIKKHVRTDSLVVTKKLNLSNVHFLRPDVRGVGPIKNIIFSKEVTTKNSHFGGFYQCDFLKSLRVRFDDNYNDIVKEYERIYQSSFHALGFLHYEFCNFYGGVTYSSFSNEQLNIQFGIAYSTIWPLNENDHSYFYYKNQLNFWLTSNKFLGDGVVVITPGKGEVIDIDRNTFNSQKVRLGLGHSDINSINLSKNHFSKPVFLGINNLGSSHNVSWNQFSNKIIDSERFDYYFVMLDAFGLDSIPGVTYHEGYYDNRNIEQYIKRVRIENAEANHSEKKIRSIFYNHYKENQNTEFSNAVYIEMKDLETERLKYLYEKEPSFDTFFTLKINQFLKVFSLYGTKPSKAIIFSLYVILAFALIYLFFPNTWDIHGKKRIMHRYTFFMKYMNKEAGINEVYLEEKKPEMMSYNSFKALIENSGEKAPYFFTATALPLYKWAISGTYLTAKLLSKADIMKGTWKDLPKKKRFWKSILLVGAFLIAIAYDIVIKILNALMLSVNTFTTLGFGEIPIKGLPRYLAIIQGFIGWFMLTIFSVSLISQLLN